MTDEPTPRPGLAGLLDWWSPPHLTPRGDIMTDEIEAAELKLAGLREERKRVDRERHRLEWEISGAELRVRDLRMGRVRPTLATMTVLELRELVADLARAHAARVALDGSYAAEWGPFRVALAELARRAEAAASPSTPTDSEDE